MHVTTDGSAASEIAPSGRRSRLKRPMSSATRCCASAALPPFPNAITRRSCAYASVTSRAARSTSGSICSTLASSSRCSSIASPTAHRSEDDGGGTDDAHPIAERGRNDLGCAPCGSHRLLAHERAHGREQLVARAGDAAAEDDELGREEVHDRRETACQR